MTHLECLKEDEIFRKVNDAVAVFPDLPIKLLNAIMKHDCCIKMSQNFEEILTKGLPYKYTQEKYKTLSRTVIFRHTRN